MATQHGSGGSPSRISAGVEMSIGADVDESSTLSRSAGGETVGGWGNGRSGRRWCQHKRTSVRRLVRIFGPRPTSAGSKAYDRCRLHRLTPSSIEPGESPFDLVA